MAPGAPRPMIASVGAPGHVRAGEYDRRMPRRSGPAGSPSDWVAEGAWPDGPLREGAPSVVAYAVAIAKALDQALEGQVRARVAEEAGIERSTLYDILAGNTWPDMVTLAKLEQCLNVTLWPTQPPTRTQHSPS